MIKRREDEERENFRLNRKEIERRKEENVIKIQAATTSVELADGIIPAGIHPPPPT